MAGTRVYEERREESLKVIADTNNKRENIQASACCWAAWTRGSHALSSGQIAQEVISHIEGRLEELDEEKEELKAYQQLDREHRALEYTLYTKELHKVRALLSLR